MAKENVYSLEGKLTAKPKTGTSYFRTRKEIAMKLATAMVKDEQMFDDMGNIKLEEDKFTIPLKVNRGLAFTGDVENTDYEEFSDNWRREMALDDIGIMLEMHFGIGGGEELDVTQEQKKKSDDERKERLNEMRRKGIVPIAYFTGMDAKGFEE